MDRKEGLDVVRVILFEQYINNMMCKASKYPRWCSHDDENGAVLESSAMESMLACGLEGIHIGRCTPSMDTRP